jgi:hypothetical protein
MQAHTTLLPISPAPPTWSTMTGTEVAGSAPGPVPGPSAVMELTMPGGGGVAREAVPGEPPPSLALQEGWCCVQGGRCASEEVTDAH